MNVTAQNTKYLDSRGKFKIGNPGKPSGAISYRTKLQISLLSCWGEEQEQILRGMLSKPDGRFLRALDRLIRVYRASLKIKDETPDEEMPPFQVIIEGDKSCEDQSS